MNILNLLRIMVLTSMWAKAQGLYRLVYSAINGGVIQQLKALSYKNRYLRMS